MWRSAGGEERMLIDYLLGNLPEEKMAQVEDRAFADRAYRATLESVEADLIDAYVRGELEGGERRGFESRFLRSPQRRKKIEFARTLARVADEEAPAPLAPEPSLWTRLFQWGRPLQFAAAMAGVAAAVGLSVLTMENRAMRQQVSGLEARIAQSEQRTRELGGQLAEEKARADRQKGATPQGPIASLFFSGSTRSSGVNRLTLDPAAQVVRIEVALDSLDNYPRFRAELRNARGEEILTRGNLRGRSAAETVVVSVDVPASAIPAGQYELAIKGVAADGSLKDLAYHDFQTQVQARRN